MRSVLKFVGESYSTACLTLLQEWINSSNVPADFKLATPKTDPAVVKRKNSTLDRGPRNFAAV
jgi:hypothetical protein